MNSFLTFPVLAPSYILFRTSLDQINRHVFEWKISPCSLALYSSVSSAITAVTLKLLKEQIPQLDQAMTLSSYAWQDSSSWTSLLISGSLCIGAFLVSRTTGNVAAKNLHNTLKFPPIKEKQIEQMNVSAVGVGVGSIFVITASCINLYIASRLKTLCFG